MDIGFQGIELEMAVFIGLQAGCGARMCKKWD